MSFIVESPPHFKEEIIDGVKVEFAVNFDGPITLFWIRVDGQAHYVVGEPQIGRDAQHDLIVYLSDMKPRIDDHQIIEVMKKLIRKNYNVEFD